jgi:integrase
MLTDIALKALRPREKPYKVSDGRGLYVIVRPDGARWWRFRYHWAGREKLLSLGTYPDVSLKLARDRRDEARQLLNRGVDPSADRQAQRQAHIDTFKAVAEDWLARQRTLKPGTVAQLRRRLEVYVYPRIGRHPIATITAPELLRMLRRIEGKGNHETAHRVRSLISRIFRYAVGHGLADRDVAGDLRGLLTPVKGNNFAAITAPKRIGELLRAIDGYHGQPQVMAALRLAPLVFVRPGELRAAEWGEFDLEHREWRIPAARMKMGTEHLVPLSSQAAAILEELRLHTGEGVLLFPSLRSRARPISDNTLNGALRRLGYSGEEHTAHGFRSMASTRLNELGYPPDVIELQLAHVERNKVRAAYNRAERIAERRAMMQAWADYLDGLKSGATVTAIGEARA